MKPEYIIKCYYLFGKDFDECDEEPDEIFNNAKEAIKEAKLLAMNELEVWTHEHPEYESSISYPQSYHKDSLIRIKIDYGTYDGQCCYYEVVPV